MTPRPTHLTRRRVRAALRLLVRGELGTVLQRARRVLDPRAAAPVLGRPQRRTIAQAGEPWPSSRPLVSAVVPTFNDAVDARLAVRSLMDQTWMDLEIIVADGGSSDPSAIAVLAELDEHPDVTVVRQPAQTLPGANRNAGIEVAQGRWVVCLDADDRLEPMYIEVALFLAERYAFDIVSSAMRCFGEVEEIIGILEYPTLDDMLRGNHVHVVALFRRSLWERAGGFVDTGMGAVHVHEDWRFWVRLAALGARIANLQAPLFWYRRNADGTSMSTSSAVPPFDVQRRRVAELNADVIDDGARAESRRRAREWVEVQDGLANLSAPSRWPQASRLSVLVMLPWLMVGGVDRYVSGVGRLLGSEGIELTIATTLHPPAGSVSSVPWFVDVTPNVFELPVLLHPDRWLPFATHLLRSRRVDVIWQLGSDWTYTHLPALRQAAPTAAVVDHLFNPEGHLDGNRAQAAHVDHIIVEHDGVRDALARRGADLSVVTTIPGGIDLDRFTRPVAGQPAADPGPLRVLWVGRLSEEKDPLAAVEVLARVPNATLTVVGAGPLEQDFLAAVVRRGDGRVRHVRSVGGDALVELLGEADVLLVTSRLDGRPQVVMEALACGTPVLATAVGDLPALVRDDVDGTIVQSGDIDGLASALRRLAGDRTRLARWSRAASEGARRFDQVRVAARVLEVFEQAAASRR